MARLKEVTPECCKDCERLSLTGGCHRSFKACAKWRTWFRREWMRICRAAEIIKKERGTKR